MSSSLQQIRENLQAMPSDQVKHLVLAWLEDAVILQQFSQWVETTQPNLEWGTVTPALEFLPLTEADMIAQSLAALAEYQRTEQSIPHSGVTAWANSLGTSNKFAS